MVRLPIFDSTDQRRVSNLTLITKETLVADKNFVGNGWEKTFDNGGTIISVSLKKEDLDKLPVNEKGYIRVVVAKRREPSDSGATHYVYEDTFQKSGASKPRTKPVDRNLPSGSTKNDLPF